MEREEITKRLLDTLTDACGAGSDLPTGDYNEPFLEVLATGPFGAGIDIEHLTSEIEALIEEATAELKNHYAELEFRLDSLDK